MFIVTSKRFVFTLALVSLLICCVANGVTIPSVEDEKPQYGCWGFDTDGVDKTTNPGDDFFRYANGLWLNRTSIPTDRPQQTLRLMMTNTIEQRIHEMLEALATDCPHNPKTLEGKLGAFYKAFMNEDQIEKNGSNPIKSSLDDIKNLKSVDGLAALMGYSTTDFTDSIFNIDIYADQGNPTSNIVYLGQSGLGLPGRDYYLDPNYSEAKSAYEAYSARLLRLIGWPNPDDCAKKIVEFESKIAEVNWNKTQQRDVVATYNVMTISDLEMFVPDFPWKEFFRNAGLREISTLIVNEKSAFPKISAIFTNTPIEILQAWQAFHTTDNAAPYLSKSFIDAHFDLHNKALNDQKEQQARWKRAVQAISGNDDWAGVSNFSSIRTMDFAVGQLYVQRYFSRDTKAKVESLAANLKVALRSRLRKTSWITKNTGSLAIKKLKAIVINVGYPDNPRDYSRLAILDDDLIGNIKRINNINWQFKLDRLMKPVNQKDWPDDTAPQRNNSFFYWVSRSCFIPAGVLQPPMFDPNADPAVNYGAIGAYIGHELTHGFDDQGRKFDSNGMLKNWWTEDDEVQFKKRAGILVAQYSQFEPIPNVKINGNLTLGENIADLGGLLIALDAYNISLQGRPAPIIDGFTGLQRVFLGWAQAWRGKATDSFIKNQVISDVHSPRKFRVNGVVRNIDAWYKTFHVKPEDNLYVTPKDRARIW